MGKPWTLNLTSRLGVQVKMHFFMHRNHCSGAIAHEAVWSAGQVILERISAGIFFFKRHCMLKFSSSFDRNSNDFVELCNLSHFSLRRSLDSSVTKRSFPRLPSSIWPWYGIAFAACFGNLAWSNGGTVCCSVIYFLPCFSFSLTLNHTDSLCTAVKWHIRAEERESMRHFKSREESFSDPRCAIFVG